VPEEFSTIYVTLISAIRNAETNLYITNAYFAPGPQMLEAQEAAARRGVDVRLLLPGHTNEPLIHGNHRWGGPRWVPQIWIGGASRATTKSTRRS
jgi:phosphatidylserine/phosphatidylglycerophosphate/cardiolipin synthase-like enzyme